MNKFKTHIPNFVDIDRPKDDRPKDQEFDTTEELLDLEDVKRFKKYPNFSHFAMSDNNLIAIYDDGFGWWVVGHVEDTDSVELPKWEGWKFRARMADGSERVLSNEVAMSCGDTLTLKDGTTATNLRKK